ncbi:MAG: FHA domain-containing protein [Armatimonadota bacterium]
MEITEFTLWAARLGIIVLMYAFLLALVFALRADVQAARASGRALAPSAPLPPDPTATVGQLMLVVVAGTVPVTGGEYPLYCPLEIGREATCAISIPNHFVSKRHARVYLHDGRWLVEDLGSTNGTLLNGQALTQPQPITPGDRLTVGDTVFEVR